MHMAEANTKITNVNRALKAWETRRAKNNNKFLNNKSRKNQLKKVNNKNHNRALKAWETRRIKKNPHLKNYDVPKKNSFRKKVIKSFLNIKGVCLALESDKFLFVNELPKTDFVIVERDRTQYEKMITNLPINVKICLNAELEVLSRLRLKITNDKIGRNYQVPYKCAFLDFCQTYDVLKSTIIKLNPLLITMEKIAFTFSLRKNKKEMDDYKFDLIKKIQEILPDFKLEYAEAYRDGAPMIGFILKNESIVECIRDKSDYDKDKNAIYDWCSDYCKLNWKHSLHEWGDPILNPRAYTETKITNHKKIVELWNNLPEEYKTNVRRWRINFTYAFGEYQSKPGICDSTYDTDLWRFVEMLC